MMKKVKSVHLKTELIAEFDEALIEDDTERLTKLFEQYPELPELILERTAAAGFEPDTEEAWERLKQRLIDDVWRNE